MLSSLFHKKYLHFHFSSIFLCVSLVVIIIGSVITASQISLLIQQMLESSALDKLNIYHNSVNSFVGTYFTNSLKTITYIANSTRLSTLLESQNTLKLQDELSSMQNANPEYYGVFLFDAQGTMLAGKVRDEQGASTQIGKNFAYREYFAKVIETRQPAQSEMYTNLLGKQVIAFSAPILDAHGKIRNVLVGSVQLEDIAKHFTNVSQIGTYNFVLTDKNGVLLLNSKNPSSYGSDIANMEPTIRAVRGGAEHNVAQEVNFAGEEVFAQSTRVDAHNAMILATFSPKSDVFIQRRALALEFQRLFFGIIVLLLSLWAVTTFMCRKFLHRDM